MITSFYVKVQGVKTFVETNNGPGEKGVMVCFGSAGRESRQYHAMMEYLEDKMKVVCFDMPGHGKSWPLPWGAPLAVMWYFIWLRKYL